MREWLAAASSAARPHQAGCRAVPMLGAPRSAVVVVRLGWEENDVSETPRNPKPPWKHSVPYQTQSERSRHWKDQGTSNQPLENPQSARANHQEHLKRERATPMRWVDIDISWVEISGETLCRDNCQLIGMLFFHTHLAGKNNRN